MWEQVAFRGRGATSNHFEYMRIRGDPAIHVPQPRVIAREPRRYDACVRMRFTVFLCATLVGACGGLLGFGEDDVDPPIRSEDSGTGSDVAADVDLDVSTGDAASDAPSDAPSDANTDAEASLGTAPKHVFVTSSKTGGNFGGRAAADSYCTTIANLANHPGTWKAYLAGDDGTAPELHVADRQWRLFDGTIVFTKGPTTEKIPKVGILVTENGANLSTVSDKFVWTGVTSATTAPVARTCNGWIDGTSSAFGGYGDIQLTGNWQSYAGTASCDTPYRLYCFED